MDIQGFFPTGVLFHQISNQLSNQIESLITPKLNKLTNNKTVNSDYNSNKIIELSEINELVNEINKCTEYFTKEIGTKPKPITGHWTQDYLAGHSFGKHHHGRSLFSVVYWVRAKGQVGDLILYDSNSFRGVWGDSSNSSPFSSNSISITPKKGMLIMFPGHLYHEVLPGGDDCIRTTIAFNIG